MDAGPEVDAAIELFEADTLGSSCRRRDDSGLSLEGTGRAECRAVRLRSAFL